MPERAAPDKRTEADLRVRVPESTVRDGHTVTIEDGEDGMLVAKCPELGVVTQGRGVEDARRSVVEAIGLMREELGRGGEFSIDVRRKV